MDDRGAARVLVVDDNKVNRLLLARSVDMQGHAAAMAENGRVALDMLRRDPFDLLLLDIEMPEMDGFEVLAEIKRNPSLRDIPVIVTSSLEGLDNIVRCIELGAEDYLHKPVNAVLLKARIGASLEKKHLRDRQRAMMERFATREVVQQLERSEFALGGKRVDASVLFCDIRGSTAIAESQPPEETIELLNAWYTLMFDAIGGHGGIVSQMMGDGLMAIFGAPVPLPGHGEAAVRAAIEMIDTVALFGAERRAAGKPDIAIGVGIATGAMVAGYTGTNERAIYTCVGDRVNLAARLETHTKVAMRPILIDAATRVMLPADIAVEELGPVHVRGRSAEVEVYAVTRP